MLWERTDHRSVWFPSSPPHARRGNRQSDAIIPASVPDERERLHDAGVGERIDRALTIRIDSGVAQAEPALPEWLLLRLHPRILLPRGLHAVALLSVALLSQLLSELRREAGVRETAHPQPRNLSLNSSRLQPVHRHSDLVERLDHLRDAIVEQLQFLDVYLCRLHHLSLSLRRTFPNAEFDQPIGDLDFQIASGGFFRQWNDPLERAEGVFGCDQSA